VLTATQGGVGVLLPAGAVPTATLDVAGDGRFAGSVCLGRTCINESQLAALLAQQQQQQQQPTSAPTSMLLPTPTPTPVQTYTSNTAGSTH
jgi:hypothetical protein